MASSTISRAAVQRFTSSEANDSNPKSSLLMDDVRFLTATNAGFGWRAAGFGPSVRLVVGSRVTSFVIRTGVIRSEFLFGFFEVPAQYVHFQKSQHRRYSFEFFTDVYILF